MSAEQLQIPEYVIEVLEEMLSKENNIKFPSDVAKMLQYYAWRQNWSNNFNYEKVYRWCRPTAVENHQQLENYIQSQTTQENSMSSIAYTQVQNEQPNFVEIYKELNLSNPNKPFSNSDSTPIDYASALKEYESGEGFDTDSSFSNYESEYGEFHDKDFEDEE